LYDRPNDPTNQPVIYHDKTGRISASQPLSDIRSIPSPRQVQFIHLTQLSSTQPTPSSPEVIGETWYINNIIAPSLATYKQNRMDSSKTQRKKKRMARFLSPPNHHDYTAPRARTKQDRTKQNACRKRPASIRIESSNWFHRQSNQRKADKDKPGQARSQSQIVTTQRDPLLCSRCRAQETYKRKKKREKARFSHPQNSSLPTLSRGHHEQHQRQNIIIRRPRPISRPPNAMSYPSAATTSHTPSLIAQQPIYLSHHSSTLSHHPIPNIPPPHPQHPTSLSSTPSHPIHIPSPPHPITHHHHPIPSQPTPPTTPKQ
jgi:hypothetical protein